MKNNKNYILRDYQKEAKKEVLGFIRDYFRGKIMDLSEKENILKTGVFLEMATGSGKTLISGDVFSYIIEVKDRLGEKLDFGGLNILILTNRKDGLNQFKNDWLHGREGKNPIFPKKILPRIESKIFHSSADNLDNYEGNNESELENFEENNNSKHKIFFSTYQTAILKNLSKKIKDIDFIVIDEAHNIGSSKSNFGRLLQELENNGRNGCKPVILGITATPDNFTKEFFGESLYTFGLPEYLASEYSPSVNYQIIASTNASKVELESLYKKMEELKHETDGKIKKEALREIENDFDKILAKVPSVEALCKDILSKIVKQNEEIGKTIIFANSAEEADIISEMINSLLKKNISLSYHSYNYQNKALDKLRTENSETKILVVVDKVNESVDLPEIENIVFWRGTDNGKIFLQQFGRGLRGEHTVNYFDYVGNLKNFSWIGNIYREYQEKLEEKGGKYREKIKEKFNIYGGEIISQKYDIDLYEIASRIKELKETQELTREKIIEYFKKQDLDYWQNLTPKEKKELKINGKGVKAISRLFGIEGNPMDYKNVWFNLLEKIFEEKIELNELTKEEVMEFFQKQDLGYWKSLTSKEKQELKINGKGLYTISTLFGIEGNPISNKNIWLELLEKIFEEKIELNELTKLTKKEIIEYFKKQDLGYWKNLTPKEKKELKINGKGVKAISRLFGIEGNPMDYKNVWFNLLEKIFEEKIELNELTKEEVMEFFQKQDLGYWKSLTSKEKQELKINGKGLYTISTLFGIEGNPISNKNIWLELLEKIFEEKIELNELTKLTKKEIIEYFKKQDLGYWKSLTSKEKQELKINGKGLYTISTLFGIKGNPISNKNVWLNLLEKIFEEKIELNELTKEEVMEYFKKQDLDYWKSLKQKEKLNVKIDGKGLNTISRLFGIKGNPISNKNIWYKLLEEIFKEEK